MIITVAHTKGGVGKSTLAWNLAHALKQEDKKVTIVDLDFQQTLYFVSLIDDENSIKVEQPQTVNELMELVLNPKSIDENFIIDVGGFDADINRSAMEFSNKILVPISDSVTEVLGFKTFENILETLILDAEVNLVLNNIHPLAKNFANIKEALGDKYKLLDTVVRSRKAYKTTLAAGQSIFDGKHTQAEAEIRGVKDELSI